MRLKIDKKGKKYLDFVKTLTIFLSLAIPLIILHEYIHYFVIKQQGYEAAFNWNILLPAVSYVNTSGITNTQLFVAAISPYFLDLVLLFGFFFFRKNKTIRLLAWVAFLHIVWNFFMLFVGLILNKQNDFIVMFMTGNGIWAVALVVLADFLWWKTIRYKEVGNRKIKEV